MSVRLNWLKASQVRFTLADHGEEMGDGQSVTTPVALCIDEGDEPILIEGKFYELAAMLKPTMRALEPYRHADLTRVVGVARRRAEGDSNDGEIEALQEALDVALTILGREDLR